jgi:phosphonate transport system substrate-binding protein
MISKAAKTLSKSTTLLLMSVLLVAGCARREVGSKDRPMTVFFVPSEDTQKLDQAAKLTGIYLQKKLSQALYGKDEGFYVTTAIPASFIAVVEAFGTGRADFACLNTFGYVLLKQKNYPGEAILNVFRGKDGKEATYKAQFIARSESKINSLQDINGKKIAYGDPSSTSGFVLPSIMLDEMGIKPKESFFAGRHDNVITAVYRGQADVGATYYSPPEETMVDGKPVTVIKDARAMVKTQYPDVESKIKIIGFSKDIPNAPWVLRSNLFKDQEKYLKVKNTIQSALAEYILTDEGKASMSSLYNITGFVKTSDEDLAPTLAMFTNSKVNLEDVVKKSK